MLTAGIPAFLIFDIIIYMIVLSDKIIQAKKVW